MVDAVRARRTFLKTSVAVGAAGICGMGSLPAPAAVEAEEQGLNVIGPKAGFTPQIGTMVSMMRWMRVNVLHSVKGMSQKDLDFLLDGKANAIGALLMHLAATETYYQLNTFDGMAWGSWPDAVKQKWDTAMSLGEAGRKTIKGNDLDYYLKMLQDTREKTFAEFRRRNDNWLMAIDAGWPWGPTNNYCKWFHVCEHESNHNGQIKLLAKRLPGAKGDAE
ncbi:MAG TPA: DUF664 domain-containing protein [Candidatus Binatia bacterium]|nr:DUF664 domain-containing protein [Candidatus Binatia bacterium]